MLKVYSGLGFSGLGLVCLVFGVRVQGLRIWEFRCARLLWVRQGSRVKGFEKKLLRLWLRIWCLWSSLACQT